jgi:hypothetical protein
MSRFFRKDDVIRLERFSDYSCLGCGKVAYRITNARYDKWPVFLAVRRFLITEAGEVASYKLRRAGCCATCLNRVLQKHKSEILILMVEEGLGKTAF